MNTATSEADSDRSYQHGVDTERNLKHNRLNYGFRNENLIKSITKRNERERRRVKMVNQGFSTLRQHLPVQKNEKKISKVETLRSAVNYINQLTKLLNTINNNHECDSTKETW